MQLAALLRFPYRLTQVGCSTPAVMVSHGVGGCLVTVVLFPPCFSFFVPAQLPLPLLPLRGSAPLPSGLACLSPACWSTPRVGLEGSGCVLFLRAFSVRCFPWGWFSGLILLRLLAGFSGLCTLCQRPLGFWHLALPVGVCSLECNSNNNDNKVDVQFPHISVRKLHTQECEIVGGTKRKLCKKFQVDICKTKKDRYAQLHTL